MVELVTRLKTVDFSESAEHERDTFIIDESFKNGFDCKESLVILEHVLNINK